MLSASSDPRTIDTFLNCFFMGLLVLFSTLIVYMEHARDCGKKNTSGGAI
jgi:hypothetical protein